MEYYKATRPDGTDFRTGRIHYTVGEVTEPVFSGRMVKDMPSTYLSVATVPTDCTGFSWPGRLFVVEPLGRTMTSKLYKNKRACRKLRVIEELPAYQLFGPQGEAVAALIERCKTLTYDEGRALTAARDAAWTAARDAARAAARAAARTAAWTAVGTAVGDAVGDAARDAARDAAWDAARAAAWTAVGVLSADLITDEQLELLYGPWCSVLGPIEIFHTRR